MASAVPAPVSVADGDAEAKIAEELSATFALQRDAGAVAGFSVGDSTLCGGGGGGGSSGNNGGSVNRPAGDGFRGLDNVREGSGSGEEVGGRGGGAVLTVVVRPLPSTAPASLDSDSSRGEGEEGF